MKTRRAALICRTSTVGQSNIRQVEELTALAQARGFLVEPGDVYEDQISGFSKHETRPALQRLLETVKKAPTKYQMVFAMEVSRISRSPEEGQKILLKLSEANVPVYIKNISMCTHMEGDMDRNGKLKRNPMFQIVWVLYSEYSAAEAESIRERSISGLRSKKMKGHAGGGVFMLYGYRRDEETKAMVIDEEERPVVEMIFQYAAKSYGLNTICKILNDAGILTKSQKVVQKGTIVTKGSGDVKRVKKTEHIRWEPGTVQALLTNGAFCGRRKIKTDEKVVDGKKVPVYTLVPCPAIISEELFDQVQKLRAEKFDKRSVDMRYLYLLKNKCICGVCGRYMAGRYKPNPKGGAPTDQYYQCSGKRTKEGCCNLSANIEALESTVWDAVKEGRRMFEYLQSTGENLQQANNKMERLKDELKVQERNQVDLEKERTNLKTLYRKGIVEDTEFDTEWKKLTKQAESTTHQIQRIKKEMGAVSEVRTRLGDLEEYLGLLYEIRKDRFQAAQVLANILEKVVVTYIDGGNNKRRHLVSIFLKDMVPPITVVMVTQQWNTNCEVNLKSSKEFTNQTRFYYHNGGVLEGVEYTEENILVSDAKALVQKLGKKLYENGKFIGWDYPIGIPILLPFQEANAKDQVLELKATRKAESARS